MANTPNRSVKALKLSKDQLDYIARGGIIHVGNVSVSADLDTLYLTANDSVVIGSSAPTSSTKGFVGQFYLIPTVGSEALYMCVRASNTYTWKQITLS